MYLRIAALARKIRESRQGAVAIHMGLITVAMIGMGALASEIGFVTYKHRQMQSAADAAAFGAAIAKSKSANFTIQANGLAAAVGFVNGANGVTVTVNNPPATGPNTADTAAVEVIIQQPQTLTAVGLFGSGVFNLGVRSVATAGAGSNCTLQLNSGVTPGVTINNGAVVNLVSCGLGVNSTGGAALSMSGGAQLNLTNTSGNPDTSQSVSVAGTASITNGATINPSGDLKTSQAPVADPYASVARPSFSGCSNGTGKNYTHSNSGLQTINPGVWCNGVSFTNDANVLLTPGVYFVDRGNFNVGGNVIMNGTGVTLVLTSSSSSNYATVTIGNGAHVTLSAPTTGATAGLVFFGDRNASASTTSNFGGGAAMNITGALYFPSQIVQFNNGISNPSGCTQLIAGTIQFSGGAKFSNNCAGTGTSSIGSGATKLVE